MFFDVDDLDQRQCYKLLTATVVPRPIAWVVTLNDDGVPNAAPFSFFNFFSGYPPVICLGIGKHDQDMETARPKDTIRNIRARGEFVINLVAQHHAEQMNITSVDFPAGENELVAAGLETRPSAKVGVPNIVGSPVTIECRLAQVMDIDTTAYLVIGHVLGIDVRDDAVIDAGKCYIDTPALDLIGRMQSPGWYARTTDLFRIRQQGHREWLGQAGRHDLSA